MQYHDIVLKQALATMLPHLITYHSRGFLKWIDNAPRSYEQVLDTELLHLCWLAEDGLTGKQQDQYYYDLRMIKDSLSYAYHATWQQRVIALAKVKGVEIV